MNRWVLTLCTKVACLWICLYAQNPFCCLKGNIYDTEVHYLPNSSNEVVLDKVAGSCENKDVPTKYAVFVFFELWATTTTEKKKKRLPNTLSFVCKQGLFAERLHYYTLPPL